MYELRLCFCLTSSTETTPVTPASLIQHFHTSHTVLLELDSWVSSKLAEKKEFQP